MTSHTSPSGVDSAPSRNTVYASVREEAMQLFATVRTLAVGEFAAYLVVLSTMLQSGQVLTVIALLVTAYGAVVFTTRMGQHWFLQALRQNTYLFVAFELPSREENRASDHRELWILAGRSEAWEKPPAPETDAEARNPEPSAIEPAGGGSRVRFAGDLRQFLHLQLALVFTVAIAGIFTLVRLWSSSPANERIVDVVAVAVGSLASVLTLVYLKVQLAKVDSHGPAILEQWLKYTKHRSARDEAYLKHVKGHLD